MNARLALRRAFSSSAWAGEAQVSPTETVSRLKQLQRLSERLSQQSPVKIPAGRLRGKGLYSPNSAGTHAVPKTEGLKPLPKTRRMAESYVEMDLLFSKDENLRETYIGGLSRVRMGRLMEDYDSLAGSAAYRFVLPDGETPAAAANYGLFLVTASVDRLDMLRPITNPDGSVPDLRLSGFVSYASASSVEVFMRMATIPPPGSTEESETILFGRFAMACRSYSGGKHLIAKLEVEEGTEEARLYQLGKEQRAQRRPLNLLSTKEGPSAAEGKMLHELFVGKECYQQGKPRGEDVVWMKDTRIKSAALMHPQERNVHSKVFGGYLMRLAYESAYATACLFARSAVSFLALDEIRFAQPVEIGSLLILDSRVSFSPIQGDHRSFHVSVEAATTNLYSGEKKVTNVFNYTFTTDKPLQRHVYPKSYEEAMHWLEGQRRRQEGIEVRRAYTGEA